MQLTIDNERFDQHQRLFIREIIEQIRFRLIEAGLNGALVKELTGHIAFSVASTIDDTAQIEFDGIEVHPYMTFEGDDDQLLHGGENSYMHEYVAELVDEVFRK